MYFHFNCQRGGEKIEHFSQEEWLKMAEAFDRLKTCFQTSN